jgi:hypothetical protein
MHRGRNISNFVHKMIFLKLESMEFVPIHISSRNCQCQLLHKWVLINMINYLLNFTNLNIMCHSLILTDFAMSFVVDSLKIFVTTI